ncbi:MAG: metallophosphoesterase [Bacteroidota bacterium]
MRLFKLILTIIIFSQFALGQSAITLSDDIFFNKKKLIKSDDKFTFAILGDKTGGGEFNWPIFDRAVDEINLLRPEFVIMVGDMIQGAVSDENIVRNMWEEFSSHTQRLKVPLLIYPGNHDMSNEVMYDYWTKNIGLRYYSFVYKNNLFLMLNTEEYRKTNDDTLGAKQLAFIENELKMNSDVNQTFIFMHRPLWTEKSNKRSKKEEWNKISSWIKDRKALIVAGHWHNLLYEKKEGNRYLVHGSTGGVLKENNLAELGKFHHYSMVSVDMDTSVISIIKPGNIYTENIANKEFIENVDCIVKSNSLVNYDSKSEKLNGEFTFSLENKLNKAVDIEININTFGNKKWKLDSKNRRVHLASGGTEQYVFKGGNNLKNSIPFPQAEYIVKFSNDTIKEGREYFIPSNDAGWKSPDSVAILGAFPLGINEKPHIQEDVINNIPLFNYSYIQDNNFIAEQIKTNHQWKILKVSEDKINGDEYFYNRDFSAAYVKFNIFCPEKKLVLAGMRSDNYGKLYLNGKTIIEGRPLKGIPEIHDLFLLPLKKGNNSILLKIADYYGNWYSQFKVLDPESNIRFNNEKINTNIINQK